MSVLQLQLLKIEHNLKFRTITMSMEKPTTKPLPTKKRKRKLSAKITTAPEPKTSKPDIPEPPTVTKQDAATQKTPLPNVMYKRLTMEEMEEKYPVLKNQDLVNRFLKVPFNNNQKGRIRQAIKTNLQGTSEVLFPDIINGKIQAILKGSENLTDSELRRVRILYNMLKTTLETEKPSEKPKKKVKKKKVKEECTITKTKTESPKNEKTDQVVKKPKGPKRYVVFLGNLPLDVDKEKIMTIFPEMSEQIKDIRIPKPAEGKKSAIAYVELSNEPSFELALSKHHSMLGSKRINVLYTTHKNGKISKAEAKSKSAKMIALQKSGKLIGSVPLNKKRSHRRMIQKQARAREAAESA